MIMRVSGVVSLAWKRKESKSEQSVVALRRVCEMR